MEHRPSWKAVNAKLRKDRKTRKEYENEITKLKMCMYEPVIVERRSPKKIRVGHILDHDFDFMPVEVRDEISKRELVKELANTLAEYWKFKKYDSPYGTNYEAELWVMEAEE